MDPKKDLTDFSGQPDPGCNVVEMLADAGLELWQAPEGFWAIRVKRVSTPAVPNRSAKRRRLEGHA
jgi:hypothetical protein